MESNSWRLYFECGIVYVKIKKHIWSLFFCVGIHVVFFYKQSNFWKQAGACLWRKLVQAQTMLAYYACSLKFCLQKRLGQAQNTIIFEKLYKMCSCCDTDYKIIISSDPHLFCCIFDKSEGKCFAILNRKNHSHYGKIHATQKNT